MRELLNSLPASAIPHGRWWPMEIETDLMWPTLAPGDAAIVVPCHSYGGEGVYAFHDGEHTVFYRAEHGCLTVDNSQYWSTHRIVRKLDRDGRAWFDVNVIGRVFASVRPFGPGLAEGGWSGP